MDMWRADQKEWKPILVNCPNGLWPNKDADGKEIYENTHFATREEAMASLWANVEAFISLSVSHVEYCQKELAEAKERVVQAALARSKVMLAHKGGLDG
jgi:hypothetical protein